MNELNNLEEIPVHTIKFDFKGIQITLRLGKWTMDAYGQAMTAILLQYPDLNIEQWGICSSATLLYLAYFNHCEITDMPTIYTWEDFFPVVKSKLLATETEQELINVFNEFLKQYQNGQ